MVGHICNFDSWRNRYNNLVLIGKNKMRQCIKNYLSLTGKNHFLYFSFLTSVTLFSHFFNQNLFKCIHLSYFMQTMQNNTILSSYLLKVTKLPITYWKSDIFLVKVQNALCWWNNRNFVSLIRTQYALDLIFFFKQFQYQCVNQFFGTSVNKGL